VIAAPARRRGEHRWQDLQGDEATERLVLGPVDDAHRSGPEALEDAEVTDALRLGHKGGRLAVRSAGDRREERIVVVVAALTGPAALVAGLVARGERRVRARTAPARARHRRSVFHGFEPFATADEEK